MITLELHEVEIDHCTSCGGIWLDRDELEQLIGNAEVTTDLLASFREMSTSPEHRRLCPICDRKMVKIEVGGEGASLVIDRCKRHHGLWFDQGELDAVLSRAALDPENKIRELLADMFGKNVI